VASLADSFLSRCGSERRAPECSRQSCPAATPHVGKGTEISCAGVSSFFFTSPHYSNTFLRNSPIWNSVSKYPSGLLGWAFRSIYSGVGWAFPFVSIALAASSVRSICGSGLVPPTCNKQGLPASTPHVGQGTASNSCGVRPGIPIVARYADPCRKTVQIDTATLETDCQPVMFLANGASLLCLIPAGYGGWRFHARVFWPAKQGFREWKFVVSREVAAYDARDSGPDRKFRMNCQALAEM
jgi:hypothetical protein